MNFKLNIIKYRYFITTIFLIVLGIVLNLPINKNLKLSLLLLGIVICIFDPMLTLPFILVIFLMYNLNTKIKKLNNNSTNNKTRKRIERFTAQNNTTFISFLNNPSNNFSQTDFNDTINPNNRENLLNTPGINNYKKRIEFIDELLETYFFNLNDYILIANLGKEYNDYDSLYSRLEFTDLSLSNGYNQDVQRNAQVPLLENKSLKKLGIYFYKNNNLKYVKFLSGNIYHLGLYSITSNLYEKEKIQPASNYVTGNILTDNNQNRNYNQLKDIYKDKETKYKNIIKSIKEFVLLLFYHENKTVSDGEVYFDFNQGINLDNSLNIYDFVDQDFLTKRVVNNSLEKISDEIIQELDEYQLKEERKFDFDNSGKINKDIMDTDESYKLFININSDTKLEAITNLKTMENELDDIFDKILDNFDKINLFSLKMYNITDRLKRKKIKFNIYNNLSLIYFLTNDNINSLVEGINSNKERYFITLYGRKKQKFLRQISSEENTGEKYQFTNPLDIFYDNLFYYYKLKYGSETTINKVYPLPDNINLSTGENVEVLGPSPSVDDDDERSPFSEVQQRNFELGLDQYLTEDQLKDKQEEELTKYYQFLDKENYSKIQTLNSLAEARNENLKIKNMSLNHVVDTFGLEIFKIIDETNELFQRTFNPKYTPSPSSEEFHSGLFDNESPSPSVSGKDSLHKYIYFFKELVKILTKEERIFHVGFIMVVLGIFIYFIDNSETYQVPRQNNLGFLQYL